MSGRVEPRSGRVIGRYVVHDEIASGGMATVHLGRLLGSAGFARTVAVKCLHPGMTKEAEFVSMLLDEAHLASRVRHPNVVQTLDVVSTDGDIFLVMEYVHGEALARLIKDVTARGEHIPVAVVVSVVAGMLFGLHAAHEATTEQGEPLGIVHRDVSPQNVLVGSDGIARVLDFGVAKAASRLQSTGDGQVKGKLRYMAPEQLKSRPVDRRTDVFAAAIVLWESLTGRRLFDGADAGAIVTQILMHEIPPPSALVPGVPEAIDAITLRGLSADPRGRYATAREMAVALERAVTPATAREVGEWLEQVAGDALKKRAARVAAIEGSGSGASPAGAAARADEPTAPLDLGEKTEVPGLSDATSGSQGHGHAELEGTSSTSPSIPHLGSIAAVPLPDARPRTRVRAALMAVAIGVAGVAVWGWLALGAPPTAPATDHAAPGLATESPAQPTAPDPERAAPAAATSAEPAPPTAAAQPPKAAARPSRRLDCDPPFVMKNGIKEFKRQCL